MTQANSEEPTSGLEVPIAVLEECKHQEVVCRKTGSILYYWYEDLIEQRAMYIIVIVVLSILTMMEMLFEFGDDWADIIVATLILLTAGALAGYFALNSNLPLDEIRESAGEFVGLSERFRLAAVTKSPKLEDELRQLMDRKAAQWKTAPMPSKRFAYAKWWRPLHPLLNGSNDAAAMASGADTRGERTSPEVRTSRQAEK